MKGERIPGSGSPIRKGASAALLVLAVTVWMFMDGADQSRVGLPFAPVAVRSGATCLVLERDTTRNQLLVIFRWQCPHCLNQLTLLDGHIEELQGTRLALLAMDADQGEDSVQGTWTHLLSAPNVVFGTLDNKGARERFGRSAVPLLLFIDREGILRERMTGFTPMKKIVSIIGRI